MDEEKQFELFHRLMLLALEKPNEINNICMRVIVSLSKIHEKTDEEFQELTRAMEKDFHDMGTMDEIILRVLTDELVGGKD